MANSKKEFLPVDFTEPSREKTESIINQQRIIKENQITEIKRFDFRDLGYSEQEIEKNKNFRETLDKYIKDSDDNPEQFLNLLSQKNIRIIKNSSFLSSQQSDKQFFGRITGGAESGINALFASRDMINNYLSENVTENIKKELGATLNSSGAIFLNKRPEPKSIFHEGAHAIQHLSNMDMDVKNEKTKLRREIEVSTALLHAKNSGKLKDVSRGEYIIGKGPFGETASLNSSDIYQEVDNFFKNKKNYLKLYINEKTKNNIIT